MNETIELTDEQMQQLVEAIGGVKSAVDAGTQQGSDIAGQLDHLSGQIDVLNQSLYVHSEYQSWMVITLMIMAAMLMFLVGYLLTRR